MKQRTMIEVWPYLTIDQKDKLCAVLRPKHPTLHRGQLSLMTVNRVLDDIIEIHRNADAPSRDGSLALLMWDEKATSLPSGIRQLWEVLYAAQRRAQKAHND